MSAPEERTVEAVASPPEISSAEPASGENPEGKAVDQSRSPEDGGIAGAKDPPTWTGVPKDGAYRELSKSSPFRRWAPAVGHGGADENVLKPGGGLNNVYFFVALTRGKQQLYLGPGDEVVLKGGVEVVYLATATKEGVAPSLVVCFADHTGTKLVDAAEMVSLVRPWGPIDASWVRDVLLEYVRLLREEAAQGLAARILCFLSDAVRIRKRASRRACGGSCIFQTHGKRRAEPEGNRSSGTEAASAR
jgi:hypothetical protein